MRLMNVCMMHLLNSSTLRVRVMNLRSRGEWMQCGGILVAVFDWRRAFVDGCFRPKAVILV
jgi:hypothetical protein